MYTVLRLRRTFFGLTAVPKQEYSTRGY